MAGLADEHCFWKQVHLMSPVTLIGLVNREEERREEGKREGRWSDSFARVRHYFAPFKRAEFCCCDVDPELVWKGGERVSLLLFCHMAERRRVS